MPAKPVTQKKDFYARFERGVFGNTNPVYKDPDDYFARGDGQPVMLRCLIPGSALCIANIPHGEVRETFQQASRKYGADALRLNKMTDHQYTTINAAVYRGIGGLKLYYSTELDNMRASLTKSPKHAEGIVAQEILRHTLCPGGYDWLMELLDEYPDHVVEFTGMTRRVGDQRGSHTLFWEVRKY